MDKILIDIDNVIKTQSKKRRCGKANMSSEKEKHYNLMKQQHNKLIKNAEDNLEKMMSNGKLFKKMIDKKVIKSKGLSKSLTIYSMKIGSHRAGGDLYGDEYIVDDYASLRIIRDGKKLRLDINTDGNGNIWLGDIGKEETSSKLRNARVGMKNIIAQISDPQTTVNLFIKMGLFD